MFPLAAFKRHWRHSLQKHFMICQQVNSYLKAHWVTVTLKRSHTWNTPFLSRPSLQLAARKWLCVCVCVCCRVSWAYTVLQSNFPPSPMGQGQLNPGTSCFKCSFVHQMYLQKIIRHHNRIIWKCITRDGAQHMQIFTPSPRLTPTYNRSRFSALCRDNKTSPHEYLM